MPEMLVPPSYEGIGNSPPLPVGHEDELPAYTRRPTPSRAVPAGEPKDFTYELKNRGGSVWASLTVQGDPRLSRAGPTITQGSNVAGSVRLALRSPEAIQAVCILIRGEIVKSGPVAPPIIFLQSKQTLWSVVEGARQTTPPAEIFIKSTAKLEGNYCWPFSVPIPTTLSKGGETFRLPHTFSTPGSFNLRYAVELRVVRGKLRPDDKITCTFVYFSMQQPGPPSALRQLAYQEGSSLFSPEADPEGWNTRWLFLKGTIFSSRMVDVNFEFSLANPLSYTRSASIPCSMAIETSDLEALDLLSTPTAAMVYLERAYSEDRDNGRNTVEPCGQAVFWPSTEGWANDSSRRRQLMGEIHLKASLQPSSAVFGFRVEYTVVVFPFKAAGFRSQDDKPLLRQPVEIVTRYAPGPRQRTYTPPTYETRNPTVDHYYKSLAMTYNKHGWV